MFTRTLLVSLLFLCSCSKPTIGYCPECNGSGKVEYTLEHPLVELYNVEPGVYMCPMCDGNGLLYIE